MREEAYATGGLMW